MRKKILSILLCTAMTVGMLTGCGFNDKSEKSDMGDGGSDATALPTNAVSGNADAEDAFVVWGWNEDIQKILDGPFKEDYPDLYERIVFVNTAGSDFYQTKVDEIIGDESNSLYPDLMGLEVDYVLKYVNSDYLLDVFELGIQPVNYANQYSYNLELGTDQNGRVKALFWQATPGCWQLKANFCKEYLGTTDPDELQKKYFSTWDKILKTAKKVNKASGGKVKLLSGYEDTFRVFSNARKVGWYKRGEDKILIDNQMQEYMELAKKLYEGELTYNTDQWGADWYANMEGDGKKTNAVLAYTGCPWFTYWSLKDSWKNNTILVAGPQRFYWGGTGLAATVGCSDKKLAGTIIKYFTCSKKSMIKINQLNSDFVNNKAAIQELMTGIVSCDYLYPEAYQNILEFYLPLADGIDASTVTAEDQSINLMWNTQVKEYVNGNKSANEMMKDFKEEVHDSYNYLSIE